MSANVPKDDPAWSVMTKRVAIEIAIVQARGGSLLDQAKSAIMAMREPTEEMINAGKIAAYDREAIYETLGVSPQEIYDAMIDEALK